MQWEDSVIREQIAMSRIDIRIDLGPTNNFSTGC